MHPCLLLGPHSSLSPFFPHRCALPPTPLPHPPTSPTPSPCFPASRLLRASTEAAAAAQWPRQPLRPHHTSPMPPRAALQHPAGRLQPHPPGAHSTTSHSRPCGLRHPLPRLQTGPPWPPSRLPQSPGPTLPWRRRDEGGPPPSRRPGPRGAGERTSPWAPLTPSLVCTPCPRALEGRAGLWPGASCQHAQLHSLEVTSTGTQPQLAWTWLRVAWAPDGRHLGDQQAFP